MAYPIPSVTDPAPWHFEDAARAVLAFLHRRVGFDLWMVTRTEGDDWIVLQAEDHGYQVKEGTVLRWADSFCSRMVEGQGPMIAPSSADVPAYAAAPIGKQLKIGAYMGVPLRRPGGELFGTLCAIDPDAQPESITHEQELLDMMGGLLSALLHTELEAARQARRLERAEAEAHTDGLTSLYNRRGWTRLLEAEEERCRRYGNPAAVIVSDLDDLKVINDSEGHFAGDELITRAASVLAAVKRSHDVVARIGGDEFTLLAIECDQPGADALLGRLRTALDEARVRASLGCAVRVPAEGLERAWERADAAMYADKERRKRSA